jgi:hypothetical protein
VRVLAVVAALALGLGCGGAQPGGRARADAVLVITCNVAQASLFVDGRYLAPVGLLRGGVAVAAGTHRLELRHAEYLPRLWEVELAAGERRAVAVELYPALP